MPIARFLIFIGILCSVCSIATAQGNDSCPQIEIYGPSGVVSIGDIARYSVGVDDGGRNLALTFAWSISDGTIKTGQSTKEIEVIQPATCVTATVMVGGTPAACPMSFSETSCGHPKPESAKLIEITGTLNKTRINLINEALDYYRPHKHIQMFLIVSGTRRSLVQKKVKALKRLFIADPSRATYVISKSREDRIVVWAVPPGADFPSI